MFHCTPDKYLIIWGVLVSQIVFWRARINGWRMLLKKQCSNPLRQSGEVERGVCESDPGYGKRQLEGDENEQTFCSGLKGKEGQVASLEMYILRPPELPSYSPYHPLSCGATES